MGGRVSIEGTRVVSNGTSTSHDTAAAAIAAAEAILRDDNEAVFADSPLPEASYPDLDPHIVARRDDPRVWLTRADRLAASAPDRTRLIRLHHHRRGGHHLQPRVLWKLEQSLLGWFAEDPYKTLEPTWHMGYLRGARLGFDPYHPELPSISKSERLSVVAHALRRLVMLPSARFLESLEISESLLEDAFYRFIEHPIPLTRLDIGFTATRPLDVGPLSGALTALRHLRVGNATMGAVAGQRWPELERLDLSFSQRRDLAHLASIDVIRPLLDGSQVPALRHLSLLNSPDPSEALEIVVSGTALSRLHTLDLWAAHPVPSREFFDALLSYRPRLDGLARVILCDHMLGDETKALFADWPAVSFEPYDRDLGDDAP